MRPFTYSGLPFLLWGLFSSCNVAVPNDDSMKSALLSYAMDTATGAQTHLRVYTTTSDISMGSLGSLAGADAVCNTNSAKPAGGVFRALMSAPGVRIASVTPDAGDGQLDWVLKPNRKYYRATDDVLIQETNSVGLFPLPLTRPISASSGNAWTGLTPAWLQGGHCTNWSSIGGTGSAAYLEASTTDAISAMALTCVSSASLICVERPEDPLKIFISNSTYLPGIDFTSIATADALCMSDSANPGGGTYKAMMVDGTTRRASTSAFLGDSQIDWVLRPFRTYVRANDGAVIQSTSSIALFTFPLQNNLGPSSGVWTGLFANWTTGPNCTAWSSSAVTGNPANVGNTSDQAIYVGASLACGNGERIVCVQQP